VDDIAGCNISRHGAEADFQITCNLLSLLGLKLAAKEVVPPNTQATWLGIDFDTTNMTMHIPKAKLTEVADSCAVLAHTTTVERQKWRSLLGKLLHITHLLSPLRLTLNRLLLGLRQTGNLISISQELKDDLLWLQANLPAYNTTVMIKPHSPHPVKVSLSAVDHVVYLQWAGYAAEATASEAGQAATGLLLLYDFMQEVANRNQNTI
jgi:hypothetical protein